MSRILTKEERKNKFESKWPEWELTDFTDYLGPCTVKHKCGRSKEYQTYFNVEKRGPTCQECVDTKKWYWNIGDIVGNLEITNRRALPNTLQEYQYKCKVCGFDCSKPVYVKGKYQKDYWAIGHSIKGNQANGGSGCACCGKKVVQPGINDIATTMPDLVDYFYDKSEANKWSKSSEHKIEVVCPICNTKQPNPIQIGNLTHEGFTCINCGNGISYPEKLMYFLLKDIGVEFEMHKVFEWSREVYDEIDKESHRREYDFYIPSINTIIEMHGSQHYRETFSWDMDMSLSDRERIDNDKYNLAIEHGCNYIIIDCRDSTKTYIVNNILESELARLFELTNINWNKISRLALNGLSKLVVEDKEKNPNKTTIELAEEYGVNFSTVIKWLKNAGIYDPLDSKKIAGLKRSFPYYSPELNIAFRTVKDASQYCDISTKTIENASRGINGYVHAGHHPETGEPLTWERWTIEQYEEWIYLHNTKL